jgi:hypothetical protein
MGLGRGWCGWRCLGNSLAAKGNLAELGFGHHFYGMRRTKELSIPDYLDGVEAVYNHHHMINNHISNPFAFKFLGCAQDK